MFEFFLDMIIFIGILSLFNLLIYIYKVRKIIKMNKDNPNIQGISIVNGEIKIIEKQGPVVEKEPIEMVKDPVCGKEISKKDAYRVVKQGVEYFFCSWECREAFLKAQKEG